MLANFFIRKISFNLDFFLMKIYIFHTTRKKVLVEINIILGIYLINGGFLIFVVKAYSKTSAK